MKVEVDVLGSPSLIALVVSVNAKQRLKRKLTLKGTGEMHLHFCIWSHSHNPRQTISAV